MKEYSKSGEPIYRYPEKKEKQFQAPKFMSKKETEKYELFLTKNIGEFKKVFHEIISDSFHLDIYIIDPAPGRDFITLVTGGMSILPMNPPKDFKNYKYAELMISLPKEWKLDDESLKSNKFYWPIFWLKFLARFVHENNTWFAQGHSIPNGEPSAPIGEEVEFTGFILLPTLLFGEKARSAQLSLFKTIHLYTLHPVFDSEMKIKLDEGLGKIFDLFDQNNVSEVVDVNRKPLC